jgi:hypothetical protein
MPRRAAVAEADAQGQGEEEVEEMAERRLREEKRRRW